MDDLEIIANLEFGKAIERLSREMQEKMQNALAGKPSGGVREHTKLQVQLDYAEQICKEYGRIWQGLLEAKNGGQLTRENVDFITQKVMGTAADRKSNLANEFPGNTAGVQSEVGRRMDSIVASIRRDLEIRIRKQQAFRPKEEVFRPVAEEVELTTGLSPRDKLAVVLACLAGIMAIILWLIERTPATVVWWLVVMVGLAVYPILHFLRRVGFRLIAMVGMIGITVLLGLYAWPRKDTTVPPGASTTPPQATSPFITIGITPAVFPISVSPHSTLSILPLHPYQTFTDRAGHLHIFDNPCGEEHVWPTQDEINSKPKNGYEEVRTVEVTNHSQFTIESGRAIFTLTYNESFGGGCMPPPKSATRQEDFVSLPSLDQGKAFRFVAINQTKSCVWLLPPATIKVKMTGDEAEREIPIKREETNIANWTDTPFAPTSVQWQGVPARNPGYGIIRSTASCGIPQTDNGLKIMYGRADLEGQTIPVTTRYSTVDGKPMVGAGENFSLSEFRVENLNSQITGDVSAEIYLSRQAQSGAWQDTASDESEFPSAFYMPPGNYGNVPSKINPQQTISLAPFWGSITGPWSPTDIIAARLKIFYGAESPAVVNFRIRKKAMSQ